MRSTYYMFQNRHSITFIYILVPCAASSLSLIHFKHEPWACCLKIRVTVHTIWPMLPPIAASARLSKQHLHGSPRISTIWWESIVTKQLKKTRIHWWRLRIPRYDPYSNRKDLRLGDRVLARTAMQQTDGRQMSGTPAIFSRQKVELPMITRHWVKVLGFQGVSERQHFLTCPSNIRGDYTATSSLIHEKLSPLIDLKYFPSFFPKLEQHLLIRIHCTESQDPDLSICLFYTHTTKKVW